MPKPDKKGWTNAGGSIKGGSRTQLFDQLDAYDYEDDYEGYGSQKVSQKKSKKQKKAMKTEISEDDHYEFPEEEAQESEAQAQPQAQADSEAQATDVETQGPSIQISLTLSPAAPQVAQEDQQVFFDDDRFADTTVELETYDNWEDAMDALDAVVSKQEEERQAAKNEMAKAQGSKVPK